MSGLPFPWSVPNLVASAANVALDTNPPFTADDFFAFYPQFQSKIAAPILDQFIAMADKTVLEQRWHESWKFGMCLFIAHFVTLYLQTLAGECSTAAQVIGAAQARGLQTSKSVGDLSVSYDFSQTLGDIKGWAAWKQTQYGMQFLSIARLLGKAGMYIY